MALAILFANEVATNMRGFRAIIRASHDPSGAPFRAAQRTTTIAPIQRSH